jgi:hypothetical protein
VKPLASHYIHQNNRPFTLERPVGDLLAALGGSQSDAIYSALLMLAGPLVLMLMMILIAT